MSRAVRIIRQSQGTEDSISLQQQREATRDLASDLGIDPDSNLETIDLGNHTGFSLFFKDRNDERIDTHPDVEKLVSDLKNGVYSHLLAYDDTRVARDEFFTVIQYAALAGGCNLEFVEKPPENRLTFRVQRIVEADMKHKEIVKAKKAVAHRKENGYWQGEPPFGLQFDDEGEFLTIDPDEWSTVEEVFRLRADGQSYREIAGQTELSKSGIGNIVSENRELYLSRMNPDHPAVGD